MNTEEKPTKNRKKKKKREKNKNIKKHLFSSFFSTLNIVKFSGQDPVQWKFVHGLFEFAIYGGRVDNPFDTRVMVSYLQQFFNSSIISPQGRSGKRLGPLKLPASTNVRVRSEVIKVTMLNKKKDNENVS